MLLGEGSEKAKVLGWFGGSFLWRVEELGVSPPTCTHHSKSTSHWSECLSRLILLAHCTTFVLTAPVVPFYTRESPHPAHLTPVR